MTKVIQFGEDVEGFDFPVLNEQEIRAAGCHTTRSRASMTRYCTHRREG